MARIAAREERQTVADELRGQPLPAPASPALVTRSPWVPRPLAFAGAWGWRLLVGGAVAYVLVQILLQLWVIVAPVLLALALAAALEPVVAWLADRRVPRGLAATVVLVLIIVFFLAVAYWIGVTLQGRFGELQQQLRSGIQQIQDWLTTGPLNLPQERVQQIRDQLTSSVSSVGATGTGFTQRWIGRARLVAAFLTAVILALFLLFFVLKDGRHMGAWLRERTPPHLRSDLSGIVDSVQTVVREWLMGTAVVGLLDATLIGLGLTVIGVPLVLPIAVLTFFGAFFPVIGATVAGGLAAILALVTGGFTEALLVVALTVVVQQIDGNVLQPIVMGHAVHLHPVITGLAVSAGLLLGGIAGALLAVPLTAAVVQIGSWYRTRDGDRADDGEGVEG